MIEYLQNLSRIEIFFLIIGFLGQGLFASRFIFQWIYSERKGESYIPIIFWYLSIFGGIGLLTYAIFRKDPVIIFMEVLLPLQIISCQSMTHQKVRKSMKLFYLMN